MATKEKRMSRKELHEQDEVMTNLQRFYQALHTYRRFIVAGAIALVVILLAISGIYTWSVDRARAVSGDLDPALATLAAPVAANEETEPAPAVAPELQFPTLAAKYEKADQQIQQFLTAHADDRLAALATMLRGAVLAGRGQWAEADQAYAKASAALRETSLEPVMFDAMATAALAQGKRDVAETHLKALAQGPTPYFRAVAQIRLGDLDNPALAEGGDAAKAKAAYEAALAALTAGDRAPRGVEARLKEQVERKIALLAVR